MLARWSHLYWICLRRESYQQYHSFSSFLTHGRNNTRWIQFEFKEAATTDFFSKIIEIWLKTECVVAQLC